MTPRDDNGAHVVSVAPQVLTYQRPAHFSGNAGEPQSRKYRQKLRPQTKRTTLLRAFLELGERGMNCFQAANQYHDYVLRSSISDFRRNFGIEFFRKYETVTGHNGSKVDCVRYWLSPAGAEIARTLLEERGAA